MRAVNFSTSLYCEDVACSISFKIWSIAECSKLGAKSQPHHERNNLKDPSPITAYPCRLGNLTIVVKLDSILSSTCICSYRWMEGTSEIPLRWHLTVMNQSSWMFGDWNWNLGMSLVVLFLYCVLCLLRSEVLYQLATPKQNQIPSWTTNTHNAHPSSSQSPWVPVAQKLALYLWRAPRHRSSDFSSSRSDNND